jgi:hypothetical protein
MSHIVPSALYGIKKGKIGADETAVGLLSFGLSGFQQVGVGEVIAIKISDWKT